MSSPLTAVLIDSDEDMETYDTERLNTVKQRLAVFDLSTEQLKQIRDVLQVSFEEGLKSEESVVKMLPTFITANTTTIKKNFIALDLGGTGFRIYLIGTTGEILHEIVTKIPENMKKGSIDNLMFFIAESLREFLIKHQLPLDNKFPVGFTFSYPCIHNNLTSATLIKWTKGFCAYGFTGKDIVELFRDACSLVKLEIGTITLINDTVGTLLACSLNDNSCSVGLVVATGFNIAYMERLANIPKLKKLHKNGNKEICINTEVGAFGDNGAIDAYKTKFDTSLDNNSINKGQQTFEKMISGMYLCELMRFVAIDLFLAGLIFNDKPTAISLLENDGFFKTSTMTRIAEYMRYNKPLGKIQNLIKKAGFTASLTDCAVLEHISSVICSRSEFLCAAAVAAICQRINKQKITIGVDSALFCTKRTLLNLESKIECLTEKKIELIDTEEASGRGAAAAFQENGRISGKFF